MSEQDLEEESDASDGTVMEHPSPLLKKRRLSKVDPTFKMEDGK